VKKSGATGEVCPVRCDLRRESDIMDLFQLIRSKYGRLSVCINNAGLAWQSTLSEGNVEQWKEMLDVSVFHVLHLYNLRNQSLRRKRLVFRYNSAFRLLT